MYLVASRVNGFAASLFDFWGFKKRDAAKPLVKITKNLEILGFSILSLIGMGSSFEVFPALAKNFANEIF